MPRRVGSSLSVGDNPHTVWAADAAKALRSLAGEYAKLPFEIGLFGASVEPVGVGTGGYLSKIDI